MLSRAADAIYWMNRYIERADNLARLLDVNLQLMLDLPASTERWDLLIETTGDRKLFQERFGKVTADNVLTFLTLDMENPNSIFSCVRAARENARSVREIISSEMWEQVNKFYLMVHAAASAGQIVDAPHEFFTAVRTADHLYLGTTDATMSYGEAWHFGRLGRLLERADKTSRILNAQSYLFASAAAETPMPVGEVQWSAVLRSASGFEMYRQRFGRITPVSVAAFLILDREFPRAMRSCVLRAEESLRAIADSPPAALRNGAADRLGRLRSELSGAEVEDIVAKLPEFLDAFQLKLNQIDDAIFDAFCAQ